MHRTPDETLHPEDGMEWPAYAFGYPFAYTVQDGGTLCAACANGGNGSRAADNNLDPECPDDNQWRIVDTVFTGNYEYPEGLRCDHCNTFIVMPSSSPHEENH